MPRTQQELELLSTPGEEHAGQDTDLGGFAGEFRQLARQRRFERAAAQSPGDSGERVGQPSGTRRTGRTTSERISNDPRAALLELSRMADRVIEAREALAVERSRANRAEHELQAVNDRLLAARGLVHEAQRTAHIAAERCSWFEGRCEALEEALDMALNASILQRWKWRRRAHARQTAGYVD